MWNQSRSAYRTTQPDYRCWRSMSSMFWRSPPRSHHPHRRLLCSRRATPARLPLFEVRLQDNGNKTRSNSSECTMCFTHARRQWESGGGNTPVLAVAPDCTLRQGLHRESSRSQCPVRPLRHRCSPAPEEPLCISCTRAYLGVWSKLLLLNLLKHVRDFFFSLVTLCHVFCFCNRSGWC